jgi:acetyl esterase/lipase
MHRTPQILCIAALFAATGLFSTAAIAQPKESVVLSMPGTDRAFVLRDQKFASAGGTDLFFDAYYPGPDRPRDTLPAIVFVSGGENVRGWPWYESYGRLAAAQAYVGIVPDKRYARGFGGTKQGYEDTVAFLEYLKAHAGDLGVDPDRVCVWVFSAGGRMASIPLAGAGMSVRAMVAYYAVLDASGQVPDDAPDRADLLARYSPLHTIRSLEGPTPAMLNVRAGQDSPGINESIAAFTAAALEQNLDVRLVNYPAGVHGFDGFDPSDASKAVLGDTFRWIAESLGSR